MKRAGAVLAWLLLGISMDAANPWVQVKTGLFAVYTDAGAKEGRERLAEIEQFRFSLGVLLGKPELVVRPALVLFVEKGASGGPYEMRSGALALVSAPGPLNERVKHELARILVDQNIGQLASRYKDGLVEFLSTTQVTGAHVVWGAPPETSRRTPDWALIHWLVTNAATYSSVRVLLGNLQNGVVEDVAYRNALGISPAQALASVAGHSQTATIDAPSRPISAERDLLVRPMTLQAVELAKADLLDDSAVGRYQAMLRAGSNKVESEEGLAILAAKAGHSEEAGKMLAVAIADGSKNPRALMDYARGETDDAKARKALERAVLLDPASAGAHFLLGKRLTEPSRRIAEWNVATSLAPLRQDYWEALARDLVAGKRWAEAVKAWQGAEHAAPTPEERQRILQERLGLEAQRLDSEEAERKRLEAAKQAEIDRLKKDAVAELRAAEDKVNVKAGGGTGAPVVGWEEINGVSEHLEGVLVRVDCTKKPAQVVVRTGDGKMVRLFAAIDVLQLTCGAQNKKPVKIEYKRRAASRGGVAGDVVAVDFH